MKFKTDLEEDSACHSLSAVSIEGHGFNTELHEHGQRILRLRASGEVLSLEDARLLALFLVHLRRTNGFVADEK